MAVFVIGMQLVFKAVLESFGYSTFNEAVELCLGNCASASTVGVATPHADCLGLCKRLIDTDNPCADALSAPSHKCFVLRPLQMPGTAAKLWPRWSTTVSGSTVFLMRDHLPWCATVLAKRGIQPKKFRPGVQIRQGR